MQDHLLRGFRAIALQNLHEKASETETWVNYLSYSLSSLKGGYERNHVESTMGEIERDTRSLDKSSSQQDTPVPDHPQRS